MNITQAIGTVPIAGGQIGAWSALAGFVGQPSLEASHHTIRAVTPTLQKEMGWDPEAG